MNKVVIKEIKTKKKCFRCDNKAENKFIVKVDKVKTMVYSCDCCTYSFLEDFLKEHKEKND